MDLSLITVFFRQVRNATRLTQTYRQTLAPHTTCLRVQAGGRRSGRSCAGPARQSNPNRASTNDRGTVSRATEGPEDLAARLSNPRENSDVQNQAVSPQEQRHRQTTKRKTASQASAGLKSNHERQSQTACPPRNRPSQPTPAEP